MFIIKILKYFLENKLYLRNISNQILNHLVGLKGKKNFLYISGSNKAFISTNWMILDAEYE